MQLAVATGRTGGGCLQEGGDGQLFLVFLDNLMAC
jgi:hypothetical protein